MSKYHYFMLYKYNPSSLIYNEIDCIYIYMCKDFNENKNKNHNFVSEKQTPNELRGIRFLESYCYIFFFLYLCMEPAMYPQLIFPGVDMDPHYTNKFFC